MTPAFGHFHPSSQGAPRSRDRQEELAAEVERGCRLNVRTSCRARQGPAPFQPQHTVTPRGPDCAGARASVGGRVGTASNEPGCRTATGGSLISGSLGAGLMTGAAYTRVSVGSQPTSAIDAFGSLEPRVCGRASQTAPGQRGFKPGETARQSAIQPTVKNVGKERCDSAHEGHVKRSVVVARRRSNFGTAAWRDDTHEIRGQSAGVTDPRIDSDRLVAGAGPASAIHHARRAA